MTSFKFRFAALLHYRRGRRDVCQQVLARVLMEQQELAVRRQNAEKKMQTQLVDLRSLGRRGTFPIDRARTRRNFVGQLADEIRELERLSELVAGQVDLSRAAAALAEQELTILQKLEEKHAAAFRYEQQRGDIRDLDEMSRLTKAA